MKSIRTSMRLAVAALFAMALTLLPQPARAQGPPERMTYQGFLVDGNGAALGLGAPKNYDVIFRIIDSQNRPKWTEQQTVTVDKGYFSVLLGEGSQVGSEPHLTLSSVFDGTSTMSVAITVKGIGAAGADVNILPPLQVLTSPYSFLAHSSVTASSLINDTNGQIVTVNGSSVGINRSTPASALDVNGTITATAFSGAVNASDIAAGTLSDARLSSNVAMLNGSQTFAGEPIFSSGLGISGQNMLEFGQGVVGKEPNAGKMGYKLFSTDSLDIVGAGNGLLPNLDRKVHLFAEGGVQIDGAVNAASYAGGSLSVSGPVAGNQLLINNAGTAGVSSTIQAVGGSQYILWLSDTGGILNYSFGTGGNAVKFGGGGWGALSDVKAKHDIKDLSGSLDKLLKLRSVTFEYNEPARYGTGTQTGFVAQEVEPIFPNWVDPGPQGMKTVTPRGFESLTVQALRELRAEKDGEIQDLKKELESLRTVVDSLVRQRTAGAQ